MTAPRIEVDLNKVRLNARWVVQALGRRGITVTGVTKAVCGQPEIADAMLEGGVTALADSRVANVARMRRAGISCPISMIRTPMPSQVDQIVECCTTSYNSDIGVIARLAESARRSGTVHDIMLMVEMGDMREGILPRDLVAIARRVLMMPGIVLKGIGANFACLSAITPAAATMAAFSALANDVERACGPFARTVSGGNSANVPWALGPRPPGRINDLRLGEAILLGIDPVSGKRIGSLATDAFTLVAEVIETKVKPEPILMLAVDPALRHLQPAPDAHHDARSILAIGQQDTDISGLTPPPGVTFMGATSDHLVVVAANSRLPVGSEMRFQVNYSALMQAMNAVDVVQVMHNGSPSPDMNAAGCSRASLALA